jgi:hypothetical protein
VVGAEVGQRGHEGPDRSGGEVHDVVVASRSCNDD